MHNWLEDFVKYPDISSMVLGAWSEVDSGWSVSNANPPRAGAKHLRSNAANNSLIRRTIGGAKLTQGLATRWYFKALPVSEFETPNNNAHCGGWALRSWRDGVNSTILTLGLGTDGALQAYLGDQNGGGSAGWAAHRLGSRSVQCIFPKTYHHIEDRLHVDGSSGTYEVRVDGVTRINVSGVNTDYLGTTNIAQVAMGAVTAALFGLSVGFGSDFVPDLADVHAWDTAVGAGATDFCGNVGCLNQQLNADTATADFAKSSGGVGYSLLQDASTSTYISSSTVGDKSAFGLAGLPGSTAGIIVRQVNYFAEKTDVSDCNLTPGFLGSGSEEGYGAESIMNAGYAWKWGLVDTDPHTSSPWTVTGANASKALFKRTL